jgi:hypothetical protein
VIISDEQSEVQTVSAKKDKKTYSTLLNQVPVETPGLVISTIVKEVTGFTNDESADAATVCQFSYELGVLNDVMVGEAMAVEDNMCLACDATSLDAEHVNEVHLNFSVDPPKSIILQIDVLPGGTTVDYVDHISRCLKDIETYSLYHGVDAIGIHQSVVKKLKSTLGDQVNVNHCVRVQYRNRNL